MSTFYNSLLTDNFSFSASESSNSYKYLTERHIHAMWFEQMLFKDLKTNTGEIIHVLSPGIWNADAGPDFLRAHIKIGHLEYRGDIEIHLQGDGWYQHQHHKDERYNDVILHLVFWNSKKKEVVITAEGKVIQQAHIESFLTVPEPRLIHLIDLDHYPYREFVGSGRCSHTLFKALDDKQLDSFFQSASNWRLSQKRTYLQMLTDKPNEQLCFGIARVFGYKNNAQQFVDLFGWLLSLKIEEEDKLFAYGMLACGFFEESYVEKWKNSARYVYYRELANECREYPALKLQLHRIRPLNHPLRRLVLLAKLIAYKYQNNLTDLFIAFWEKNYKLLMNPKQAKKFYLDLEAIIPHESDAYWNYHYSFETSPKKDPIALIGADAKREILLNALFPLLEGYLLKKQSREELDLFHRFFKSLPASYTSKTRYLTHRLFGDDKNGEILSRAFAEQGAYQVHHDFCVHHEASCEGCPFVERFQSTIISLGGLNEHYSHNNN